VRTSLRRATLRTGTSTGRIRRLTKGGKVPRERRTSPSECPVCGATVPPNSSACPACGADQRTGWNEEATRYDGLDLPDSAFDETRDEQEVTPANKVTRTGISVFTWVVALVILLLFVVFAVLGLF
jgi:hypothetical protein